MLSMPGRQNVANLLREIDKPARRGGSECRAGTHKPAHSLQHYSISARSSEESILMDSGATRCWGPDGLLSKVGSGESGAMMESAKARAASARLSSSLLDSGLSSRRGVAAGAVRCLTEVRGRLPLLELSPLEERRSLE